MRFQKVVFALFLLTFACSKDDDIVIPSEFSTYVESFVAEGKSRGVDVDVSKLNVNYVTPQDNNFSCAQGEMNPPHIKITKTTGCWLSKKDIDKEILFFHEMGHATLKRFHLDDTLPNGDFKSMMATSVTASFIYSEYVPERKKYYLDELFDPSTPAPAWSNRKTEKIILLSDSISGNNNWNFSDKNKPGDKGSPSKDIFSSAGQSLSINSTSYLTNGFSYWYWIVNPIDIPTGSQLILKVKIKTVNAEGKGAYIAVRGDTETEVSHLFATTQGTISITGSTDFKEYSVKVNYVPSNINSIAIYLILDGLSMGTAYFDDISLVNYR